jgi:hypothetical protein
MARPQHGYAAVSRHGVQPRLEQYRRGTIRALQVRPCGRERLLERILGLVSRAEDVAAHREQSACVALVGGLEGSLVSPPHLPRQPLVTCQREQVARRTRSRRVYQSVSNPGQERLLT